MLRGFLRPQDIYAALLFLNSFFYSILTTHVFYYLNAINQTSFQFPATFYPQILVPIITAAPTRYTCCTSFFESIPLFHPHSSCFVLSHYRKPDLNHSSSRFYPLIFRVYYHCGSHQKYVLHFVLLPHFSTSVFLHPLVPAISDPYRSNLMASHLPKSNLQHLRYPYIHL